MLLRIQGQIFLKKLLILAFKDEAILVFLSDAPPSGCCGNGSRDNLLTGWRSARPCDAHKQESSMHASHSFYGTLPWRSLGLGVALGLDHSPTPCVDPWSEAFHGRESQGLLFLVGFTKHCLHYCRVQKMIF